MPRSLGNNGFNLVSLDVLRSSIQAAQLASGPSTSVNPNDAGYDVVLLLGQSNMAGGGGDSDPMLDPVDPRIWQWGTKAPYVDKAIVATHPLQHVDIPDYIKVGPGIDFGRAYADTIPANRKVMLIPAALGGSPLVGGPWQAPSGELYLNAISLANKAVAAPGGNNRVVAMLWQQGEADATNDVPQATYRDTLIATIAGLRSSITGAGAAPFIIGLLPPAWAAGVGARATAITNAFQEIPALVPYTATVTDTTGLTAPDIHFDAPGARELGRKMFARLAAAKANLPLLVQGAPGAPTISGIQSTGATASWSPVSGGSLMSYTVTATAAGKPTVTATVGALSTTATLSGLVADTTYIATVKATGMRGDTVTGPASAPFTTLAKAAPVVSLNTLNSDNITFAAESTTDILSITGDVGGGWTRLSGAGTYPKYVTVAGAPVIQFDSAVGLTLTANVNAASSYSKLIVLKHTGGNGCYFCGCKTLGSPGSPGLQHMLWWSGGAMCGQHGTLAVGVNSISSAFTPGEGAAWVCLGLTWNSATGEMKMYRNGSVAVTGTVTTAPSAPDSEALTISGIHPGTGMWGYYGYFAAAKFWGDVLTPSDMLAEYQDLCALYPTLLT